MIKKILYVLAGLIVIVFLVGFIFFVPRDHVDLETFRDLGKKYDVEILRDKWGVPHVFGKTDADTAFGIAYAHAEDDFVTIQGTLLASRGMLATELGLKGAPNDYMVQLLNIWDTINEKYEKNLSPETRAICRAYAEGLNYYASLHPDQANEQLYPARGKDVAAGFVHKVPLFFDMDQTLKLIFNSETPLETEMPVEKLEA
ncbi:MAG: penicillin acylase family protein, partial [Desulfobacterales bacterium]|nr:penicillin acylase family protein [Desulfobacterales bacterium]